MKDFNNLQPTIVQFLKEINNTDYQLLNKQFACFVFPYAISGSGSSSYSSNEIVFNYDDETGTDLNMPLIYLVLTKDILNTNYLYTFVNNVLWNASIWNTGIENFKPGINYFINEILAAKLRLNNIAINQQYVLPNVLLPNDTISNFWKITYNKEINSIFQTVANENALLDLEYTEEELNNFYSTFASIILEYTQINDETLLEGKNPIYTAVLNYYKNMKTDAASIGIGLMLGQKVTGTTQTTGCGCSTTTSSTLNTTSCLSSYETAMQESLKEMLGNVEFYNDWFRIELGTINEPLINTLLLLIKEFKSLNYNLSFSTQQTSMCSCPNLNKDESDANYKKIDEYVLVLNYVHDDLLCENKNKIKVYGEAFAELLPKLQF